MIRIPKANLAAAAKHEAEPVRRIPPPPGMAGAPVTQESGPAQTIAARNTTRPSYTSKA